MQYLNAAWHLLSDPSESVKTTSSLRWFHFCLSLLSVWAPSFSQGGINCWGKKRNRKFPKEWMDGLMWYETTKALLQPAMDWCISWLVGKWNQSWRWCCIKILLMIALVTGRLSRLYIRCRLVWENLENIHLQSNCFNQHVSNEATFTLKVNGGPFQFVLHFFQFSLPLNQ